LEKQVSATIEKQFGKMTDPRIDRTKQAQLPAGNEALEAVKEKKRTASVLEAVLFQVNLHTRRWACPGCWCGGERGRPTADNEPVGRGPCPCGHW